MERKSDIHLEDVAITETKEKSPVFDMDKEFGPGTRERLVDSAVFTMKEKTTSGELLIAARWLAHCLLLGSRREQIVSEEEYRTLYEALKEGLDNAIEAVSTLGNLGTEEITHRWVSLAKDMARYRVLTGKLFREGVDMEKMEQELSQKIVADRNSSSDTPLLLIPYYRLLFDKQYTKGRELEFILGWYKEKIHSPQISDHNARIFASDYRILRAHEINFIPGKGIEIIDEAPEFQKESDPLPETRNF